MYFFFNDFPNSLHTITKFFDNSHKAETAMSPLVPWCTSLSSNRGSYWYDVFKKSNSSSRKKILTHSKLLPCRRCVTFFGCFQWNENLICLFWLGNISTISLFFSSKYSPCWVLPWQQFWILTASILLLHWSFFLLQHQHQPLGFMLLVVSL